jgi:hypothetical protein
LHELEKEMKARAKESDKEIRLIQRDTIYKIDLLDVKLTSAIQQTRDGLSHDFAQSLKDTESNIEKKLSGYAIDQQKQLSNLWFRSMFAVSLTLYVINNFLTQSRYWVFQ